MQFDCKCEYNLVYYASSTPAAIVLHHFYHSVINFTCVLFYLMYSVISMLQKIYFLFRQSRLLSIYTEIWYFTPLLVIHNCSIGKIFEWKWLVWKILNLLRHIFWSTKFIVLINFIPNNSFCVKIIDLTHSSIF